MKSVHQGYNVKLTPRANVAELVDALDLGSSRFPVRVRVSPFAPLMIFIISSEIFSFVGFDVVQKELSLTQCRKMAY